MAYRQSKNEPGTNNRDCPNYSYRLLGKCILNNKLEEDGKGHQCIGTHMCEVWWTWFRDSMREYGRYQTK